jgi:hypothetical protein
MAEGIRQRRGGGGELVAAGEQKGPSAPVRGGSEDKDLDEISEAISNPYFLGGHSRPES